MDAVDRPTIVCVTPVKDEAWILERFLRCAGTWADHIVVADQGSTDGSREMARAAGERTGKVTVIENRLGRYDEAGRQKLLLEAARRVPLVKGTDRRLILALDADEVLSANFRESAEWGTILGLAKGTVVCFNWVNLLPDMRSGWIPEADLPLGYMDDGAEHGGGAIHNFRVPTPRGAARLACHEIRVLHYQYTDWQRMKSKHRWYQCWEWLNREAECGGAVSLFRKYHHMYAVAEKEKVTVRGEWLKGYGDAGIDVTSVKKFATYYWDLAVAEWIVEFGAGRFSKLDIWDVGYEAVWRGAGRGDLDVGRLKDPRTVEEKEVIAWLRRTQATCAVDEAVRRREGELRGMGW